ncbi:MAG: hypothetical protein ACR2O4_04920, partial [Hyphomicrobiaceae bacterium]
SLALRRARGNVFPDVDRVSLTDLGRDSISETQGQLQLAASTPVPSNPIKSVRARTKTIGVTRAVERIEQEVVREAVSSAH